MKYVLLLIILIGCMKGNFYNINVDLVSFYEETINEFNKKVIKKIAPKNGEYYFISSIYQKEDPFNIYRFSKCINPEEKIFQYAGKVIIKKTKLFLLTNYDIHQKPFNLIQSVRYENNYPIFESEYMPLNFSFYPIYIEKNMAEKMMKNEQQLFSYNEIKDYILYNKEQLEKLICENGNFKSNFKYFEMEYDDIIF